MPVVMMPVKRPHVSESIWLYSSWFRKYMVTRVEAGNTVAAIFFFFEVFVKSVVMEIVRVLIYPYFNWFLRPFTVGCFPILSFTTSAIVGISFASISLRP